MKLPDCHNDETPVNLTVGEKEQSLTALSQIHMAAVQLDSLIKKNDLTVSDRYSTFRYIEARVQLLTELLHYDSDVEDVRKGHVDRIRELNEEVAELKTQLGKSVDFVTAKGFFLSFLKDLKDFMKSIGLSSYMKDEHFKSCYNGSTAGMSFEGLISCAFSEDDYFMEEQSKDIGMEAYLKQRIKNLTKQGLNFYKNDKAGKYLNLIDCPENRDWLIKKFKEQYPTALFIEFENHVADDKTTFILRMAKVRIVL